MNERTLSVLAIVASVLVGVMLFASIGSVKNTVREGNELVVERVTMVQDQVTTIDSVKIPAIINAVKTVNGKAEKAQSSANWANGRISSLEKTNKILQASLDSVKAQMAAKEDENSNDLDDEDDDDEDEDDDDE